MGKGDKRSKKGKIFRGSYGKTRLRKQKSSQKSIYSDVKKEKRFIEKKEKPVEPLPQEREAYAAETVKKKIEQVPVEVQVQEEIKPEMPLEPASHVEEKPSEIIETETAAPEIVEEVLPPGLEAEPEQLAEEIKPEEIKSEAKQVEVEMTGATPEVTPEPVAEMQNDVKPDEVPPVKAVESAAGDQTVVKTHAKKEAKGVKSKTEKKKTDETKTTPTKRGRPKKKKD